MASVSQVSSPIFSQPLCSLIRVLNILLQNATAPCMMVWSSDRLGVSPKYSNFPRLLVKILSSDTPRHLMKALTSESKLFFSKKLFNSERIRSCFPMPSVLLK